MFRNADAMAWNIQNASPRSIPSTLSPRQFLLCSENAATLSLGSSYLIDWTLGYITYVIINMIMNVLANR